MPTSLVISSNKNPALQNTLEPLSTPSVVLDNPLSLFAEINQRLAKKDYKTVVQICSNYDRSKFSTKATTIILLIQARALFV